MSDLDVFKPIEQELAIKFKQVDEIKPGHRYAYTLDEEGRVSGLGLHHCWPIAQRLVESFSCLKTCVLSSNLINDASFLRDLTSLQSLNIEDNSIRDVSFLKGLTNLKSLNMGFNQVIDFSFLKDLTNLQSLSIGQNQISDFSFLKNLTNLESLDLGNNKITDYSFFKELTNLRSLRIRSKNISDVSFFKGIPNLQSLDLWGEGLSDVSFLKELTQLRSLKLDYSPIKDPSFLREFKNLQSLVLLNYQSSDTSSLKELKNLQSLFLWNNKIEDFSFIKELTNLQSLSLWSNKIQDLSFIIHLRDLQTLSLRSNNITDHSLLSDLSNLQSLSFHSSNIRDFNTIRELTHLQALNLSGNQINDASFVRDLTNLQSLDLELNQIREVSFLRNLTHLKSINLKANQIKTLPEFFLEFGLEIINDQFTPEDHTIYLYENPIASPPMEIIEQGNTAIRDYFRSMTKKQFSRFNEVKVLFMGEGLAGKTSLLKQIQGLAFDKDESQTHGINVVPVSSSGLQEFARDDQLRDVGLNCWDFGGQEVMHASHRFFMSKRSLYVLLLDSRTDAKKYHWLKHIEKYGGDSPVIVVMNKIDLNPNYNIEQNKINAAFPNIKNRFCRVSCKNGDGIRDFMCCLARSIPETPLFGTPISRTWLDIKDRLVSETRKNQYISRERFETICAEYEMDSSSRHTLLQFLHDLGIVLYFDNLDLADIYVLDPHWVTIGVYKIINSAKISKGILNERDLDFILNTEDIKSDEYDPARKKTIRYSLQEQRYLLKIMMQFELCYDYDPGKGLYMIPDQLPKELDKEPELSGEDTIRFIMKFDYLPSSLLSRLMIRFKNDIVRGCQWKYGMLLENRLHGCRCKIVSHEEAKNITIAVQGDSLRKREHLSAIRLAIHDIGREFENLLIEEFIPLPGYPDDHVGYRELTGYEKAGKDEYFSGKLGRSFSVSRMLDSVITKEQRNKEAFMPDIKINITDVGNPSINVQQHAELTATQEQTVTQEVKAIQGLFKNLKEDLLDEIDIDIEDPKEKKRIHKELEKAEAAFMELEQAAAEGRKELEESTKNRLGEFIDNLADENSRINKALKLISRGAEKAKSLGKTYNKFAPYFGLPNVPPVLLGD